MSSTQIYAIDETGDTYNYGDARNSFMGAIAVWTILEGKYLPPMPKPTWMGDDEYNKCIESRNMRQLSRCFLYPDGNGPHPLQPVWDLCEDPRLMPHEQIALMATFDRHIVMRKDVQTVIDAFRAFEGNTNLSVQADILELILNDSDSHYIGAAWNQTSVNCGTWSVYDEETETSTPYNIFKYSNHYDVFKRIDEIKLSNIQNY